VLKKTLAVVARRVGGDHLNAVQAGVRVRVDILGAAALKIVRTR
jgi:hypothetical protein